MKSLFVLICVLALTFSILVETSNFPSVNAQARSDLEITWYSDISLCYSALKNHTVDITGYPLTYEQFEDAQADPDVQLASYDENGIFEFDINNNYSIPSYPNVKSPTSEIKVRQAIAHLINKTYIIEEILPDFFGNIIDVPISNALNGWWNTSVTGDNYPYPYNPDAAAALLASLGFNDTDGNGYLNYPEDWPGIENLPNTDTTEMPLKMFIRQDHEDRKEAGLYLVSQLEGVKGDPADSALAKANWPSGFIGGDFAIDIMQIVVTPLEVVRDRNYHIYTGGWSLSRFPAEYMYYMFSLAFWCPYGLNYVGAHYPDLDEELYKAYYAQNISSAIFIAKMPNHC